MTQRILTIQQLTSICKGRDETAHRTDIVGVFHSKDFNNLQNFRRCSHWNRERLKKDFILLVIGKLFATHNQKCQNRFRQDIQSKHQINEKVENR
jgi:hypothetical protein